MGVAVTRVVKFIRKGTGISRTDVEYADSTSNSVAPTSGWTTNAPAWQNGHYIWQRVRFIYTDGTDGYSNPVCLSGGKGISKIEEYYLATSASSGVTTSTSGWTKAVQSVTATKKYLWNYEVVTYTDGTTTTTTPVIIGTYGDKGVGITSITEHYLATSASSGVTRSTSGWTTSIQTVTNAKKYLWNYETVTYTDGSTADTDPVIIGVYGDTGNGISSVTEYYLASSSSSGVTRSTTGWTTDPTATAATMTSTKKYLWNYERINYTNGTHVDTTPAIIGRFGDTGVGITSITEHYLATSASSGVTRSTSGWTTSIQTVTNAKKYLWNYETVTYTDGSTADTDPVIIGVYGDTGNGISSTTAYYLISALRTGVTRSTSGWVANTFQVPTAEKPYAWRYAKVVYTNGDTVYTDAELIAVWQAGANPNLLDDTEFKSIEDMKAWNKRAYYAPVSGQTTPAESNADYITTGTQGEKSYYSKTNYDNTRLLYKEILQQHIWENATAGIKKIEPSTWYTFSFYAKGIGCTTYIYPSCVDTSADFFIDGVKQETVSSDAAKAWTFTGSWVRHTVTFKTKSSFYNSSAGEYSTQSILFRLTPNTSTSASNYAYICMPKLEVGMMATAYMPSKSNLVGDRGPALRGPQAWSDCAVGYSFMQGAEGEAYAAVVLYNVNYYSCIKSHTKTANNYPTSSLDTTNGYWTLGEKVDLIATRILLATYALVKNLGVEAIDMKDSGGNILFQAKDGVVTCKTGTFENVLVKGGLRSPFTYLGRGNTFDNNFSDNIAVYSASQSTYALPWTTDQSGRKVVITNYYWNGSYSTASGYAQLTAPTGKYFYEDGIQKSTIKLSREAVELLGYGDNNNFYGWIVLKRIDLGTESRYGHHMKMLAVGRVTGSGSGASVSYHTFDGSTMSVTRDGQGIYTLSWSNNNWYADAGHVFVMVCGYGVIDSGSNPLYASVKSQTKTSITVQTADDDSRNDGAFNFFLMNFNDWIYL